MNVNIPEIIKAAVPESKDRNVQVVSDNLTGNNYRDQTFLSSNFSPPKLYITGDTDDFDELTVQEWRDEGFDVEYFSMEAYGDGYLEKIKSLSKGELGPCEKFGIIAFDEAASICLQHFHVLDNNPEFKLGLLIAYYPTTIPSPSGAFPSSISTLVHLPANDTVSIIQQSQMVGIQGKKRKQRKKIERGLGTGGKMTMAWPSYTYDAGPGFAEHDLEEFERVSAELAWGRSLAVARRVFGMHPDLEGVVERNLQSKFFSQHPEEAVSTYTTHKPPHVSYIPTLTGGIGATELNNFYTNLFVLPPSSKVTLLSRTIGTDRIVDEMHLRFKHTLPMPWLLPSIPATNKNVEVVMVSIVAIRGGKLYSEHVYWDQASVLKQAGLLDPKLVSESAREMGVKKLPVVGRTSARRVLGVHSGEGEEGEADNKLVGG